MIKEIIEKLYKLRDEKYAIFQASLIPTIDKNTIIGVRIPALRVYAKEIKDTELAKIFIQDLPHKFYDEDILHSLLLSFEKDFINFLEKVENFLPYIDNWAVCDIISPKFISIDREKLLLKIDKWIDSDKPYTIRFGISMLMKFYLDDYFKIEYNDIPLKIKSNNYYVNMMISWYYATALSKQWESTINILENKQLSFWIHNKTIQKAIESFRITDEQKKYLKSLRIKNINF